MQSTSVKTCKPHANLSFIYKESELVRPDEILQTFTKPMKLNLYRKATSRTYKLFFNTV